MDGPTCCEALHHLSTMLLEGKVSLMANANLEQKIAPVFSEKYRKEEELGSSDAAK